MERGIVLEDHVGAQQRLVEVLEDAFPAMTIVKAKSIAEAGQALKRMQAVCGDIELALVDLGLPDGRGVDFIREMRQCNPDCVNIVVTIHDDDYHVINALRAGAAGYLLKQQSKQQLVQRLQGIVDGEPPLSPAVACRILASFAPDQHDMVDVVTAREKEVLVKVARGFTLQDIADALDISRNTVAVHVKNIYRKLEVSSRAEVTQEAIRLGLV